MILLSFAGFLRFDEVSSFLCSDVKIECEYLFLFIRKSKTDQYRNGNEVLIAKGKAQQNHSKISYNQRIIITQVHITKF
jgi:hypothetical protein